MVRNIMASYTLYGMFAANFRRFNQKSAAGRLLQPNKRPGERSKPYPGVRGRQNAWSRCGMRHRCVRFGLARVISGETKAFTDVDDPAAAVAVATSNYVHDPDRNLNPDRTVDARRRTKLSAHKPVERFIKSALRLDLPSTSDHDGAVRSEHGADGKWRGFVEMERCQSRYPCGKLHPVTLPGKCRALSGGRAMAIISQGRAQAGLAGIGTFNRAINLAIRPMSDLAQWGGDRPLECAAGHDRER